MHQSLLRTSINTTTTTHLSSHLRFRLPAISTPIHRPFSTTRSGLKMNEYLVTIPDHANALSKRLAARPAHLTNLKPHIDSGKVVFGGAILSQHPKEGEGPDMTGSVMLIKANSEEEVREWVQGDEYTKQGAWDVSRMTITPFRCAVRTAM